MLITWNFGRFPVFLFPFVAGVPFQADRFRFVVHSNQSTLIRWGREEERGRGTGCVGQREAMKRRGNGIPDDVCDMVDMAAGNTLGRTISSVRTILRMRTTSKETFIAAHDASTASRRWHTKYPDIGFGSYTLALLSPIFRHRAHGRARTASLPTRSNRSKLSRAKCRRACHRGDLAEPCHE